MSLWLWVVVGVAGVAVLLALLVNLMIGRKNAVHFAFSSVDAMLKQRYDLIPNLVSVCERYMQHERSVLAEITATRTQAMQAAPRDVARLNEQLSAQLKNLFALAEGYPELKAAAPFDSLQQSLNEVEAQIAASRRAYNAAVLSYNNACEMIPTSIVAAAMGYKNQPMFEVPEEERQPLKVWRS